MEQTVIDRMSKKSKEKHPKDALASMRRLFARSVNANRKPVGKDRGSSMSHGRRGSQSRGRGRR